MTQYTYSETEVLLYDPLAANRAATRASLLAIGFRRIDSCTSIIGLTDALVRNPPHLVICDCGREDGRLFAFLQDLRQANTPHNPFLPVILTSWDKGADLMRSAVDSGVDDFVLRPFSTDVLAQRIAAIVERRKSFVISTGYVGPDRRFGRGNSTLDFFSPPNVLKSNVERGPANVPGATLLERDVAEARTQLHLCKLRSDALRLGVFVRQWQEARTDPSRSSDYFGRMQALALSMQKRCEELKDEKLAQGCAGLRSDLMALTDGGEKQAERLEKAAGDLYISLTAGSCFEKFKREMDSYLECVQAKEQSWVMVAV